MERLSSLTGSYRVITIETSSDTNGTMRVSLAGLVAGWLLNRHLLDCNQMCPALGRFGSDFPTTCRL